MPHRRLKNILEDLQEEMHSGGSLDDDDKEALRALMADLQAVLDQDEHVDGSSALSSLKDATVRFESTHPRLTELLSSISDLLRSAGIS